MILLLEISTLGPALMISVSHVLRSFTPQSEALALLMLTGGDHVGSCLRREAELPRPYLAGVSLSLAANRLPARSTKRSPMIPRWMHGVAGPLCPRPAMASARQFSGKPSTCSQVALRPEGRSLPPTKPLNRKRSARFALGGLRICCLVDFMAWSSLQR